MKRTPKYFAGAVLALASMCALGACSAADSEVDADHEESAITGGKAPGQDGPLVIRKSVVALAPNSDFFNGTKNPKSSSCSGIVISNHHVLTAAHCVEFMDRVLTQVVFGADMKSARAAKSHRQAKQFVKHPGYPDYTVQEPWGKVVRNDYASDPEKWMKDNPGKAPNDLAIIRFEGEIPDGFAAASGIFQSEEAPKQVTLAGFGMSGNTKFDDSGVLRFVDNVKALPISSDSKSRHFIEVAETLDVALIARGEKPKGACPGDSGGPAFVVQNGKPTLVGILSLGELEYAAPDSTMLYCLGHTGRTSPKTGNIFTDVRAYKSWIDETMKALP